MEELLKLRNENDELVEKLLDYRNVNKSVYKKYLDIAMVACCDKTFVHDMTYLPMSTFQELVTVAEEAFAILILENNVTKWVHIAQEKEGVVLQQKFQKQVNNKIDKENRKNAAGDWKEEGMIQFNKIVEMVTQTRSEPGRAVFDKQIKEMYEAEVNENGDGAGISRKRKKVDRHEKLSHENQIVVTNTFDASICR